MGYMKKYKCPVCLSTHSVIRGHLERRLQKLRSFQTIKHAILWFNGYFLKRRYTKFTDCRGKFRYLRGKTGVQMTKKERV